MTSLETQLDSLRKQFEQNSLERLHEMSTLLRKLEANLADTSALRELLIHFHWFAGLGTTYGYPAATSHGQVGEARTAELLRNGGSPTRDDVRKWREILEEVRSAVAPQ